MHSRRPRSPRSRRGSIKAPRGTPRPSPRAPAASAVAALSALERMDITPEQRNYWAFKLPVQAPVPLVANRGSHQPDRSLPREGAGRSRADRRRLVPIGSRWCGAPIWICSGCHRRRTQVAAFIADDSRYAWERLIDRLLASPHYGERYGRHWLDVARYADSARLRVRHASAQRLALSRLRHQVVQRRQAVQPVSHRADRRRRDGLEDRADPDRHRLSAHGPARAVPREGQSRTPLRLSRRDHRHHRQGHDGAHRQLRALPQPQVRSDCGEGLLRDPGVALRLRRNRGAAGASRRGRGVSREERGRSTRRCRR